MREPLLEPSAGEGAVRLLEIEGIRFVVDCPICEGRQAVPPCRNCDGRGRVPAVLLAGQPCMFHGTPPGERRVPGLPCPECWLAEPGREYQAERSAMLEEGGCAAIWVADVDLVIPVAEKGRTLDRAFQLRPSYWIEGGGHGVALYWVEVPIATRAGE